MVHVDFETAAGERRLSDPAFARKCQQLSGKALTDTGFRLICFGQFSRSGRSVRSNSGPCEEGVRDRIPPRLGGLSNWPETSFFIWGGTHTPLVPEELSRGLAIRASRMRRMLRSSSWTNSSRSNNSASVILGEAPWLCCINCNKSSEPTGAPSSCGETEQLVHQTNFACHARRPQHAVTSADHPHHL